MTTMSLPVGWDLNLELQGRCRQTLRFGIFDILAGLTQSALTSMMSIGEDLRTHITVVFDTKVKAQILQLLSR